MTSTNKTVQTEQPVADFLAKVENPKRRAEGLQVLEMLQTITQEEPVMWGPSIIGFGKYHYKYASGREGDSGWVGFSPRKQNLTIYIVPGFSDFDQTGRMPKLLAKLGKYKLGKCCLYLNSLKDVDIEVLKELIDVSVKYMKHKYGPQQY